MAQETVVVIVGAGPAGIATSACLNRLSVPNVVLESENCCASLWKNRSYDRLKLHLAKQYCQLPNMPFPDDAPTFVPKSGFIRYLDNYVSRFKVKPLYGRSVRSAVHEGGRWQVEAVSGETAVEMFLGRFLVVATGENSERFAPKVVGLEGFGGGVLHSCEYVNGERFRDKDVLVVGSGNSGMEIAFDLSNYGVRTAISIRSPVHVLTKEIVQVGMYLLKWLPCSAVDSIAQSLSKLKYGDLSQYGIQTPTKGPFYLKRTTARSPVIDVGTIDKIKTGEIRVFPSLSHVKGDTIEFVNGKVVRFDAIVFATGYRTTVRKWLKDDGDLFNDYGMPKQIPPDHWKGNKGLYCAGFSSSGLFGISQDAENIAKDISSILNQSNN